MVKIFVGNIADGVSTEEMRELFEHYGKVTECDVLGTYGFVHLATDAEAEHAIKNLDKKEVKGQPINVEKSKSGARNRDAGGGGGGGYRGRGGRGGGMRGGYGYGGGYSPIGDNSASAKSARRAGCTKLHIANLPDGVYSSELRDLFSRYGYVAECDVVEDRKIAFVHIEDEAADAAIHGLNGHNFKGIPLKVQMSKNQSRLDGGSGMLRGGVRGGMGSRGGRGGMMGRSRPDFPVLGRGFGRDRGNGAERGFGSNGDSGYGDSGLPPPVKDRMELLELLDRKRRLEALDPYERRLISCPDPYNLPPPPPEYLSLLRERAMVKIRLPHPPSAGSALSRSLPTAGSAKSSSALTRALIARRAAAVAAASAVKEEPLGSGMGLGMGSSYGDTKATSSYSYSSDLYGSAHDY